MSYRLNGNKIKNYLTRLFTDLVAPKDEDKVEVEGIKVSKQAHISYTVAAHKRVNVWGKC